MIVDAKLRKEIQKICIDFRNKATDKSEVQKWDKLADMVAFCDPDEAQKIMDMALEAEIQ